MRAVFRCVASRNRVVSLGTPTGPFGQEIGTGSAGREKKGRLFAVQPPTKVRPCAHPPEALRAWAQRPAMQSIATGSAKLLRQTVSDRAPFSAHSRLVEAGGRRHPRRKAAISRLRSSDLRWRRPKNYSAATLLRPTVNDRAPGKFFRFNSSLKRGISLLRRGARDFSLHFATQTQQKPLWGRSALESWSWLGNKLRLPCAGGGRVTPAGRAKLRFAWA